MGSLYCFFYCKQSRIHAHPSEGLAHETRSAQPKNVLQGNLIVNLAFQVRGRIG